MKSGPNPNSNQISLTIESIPGAALQDALRLRHQVLWHVGGRAGAGHDDAAGGGPAPAAPAAADGRGAYDASAGAGGLPDGQTWTWNRAGGTIDFKFWPDNYT